MNLNKRLLYACEIGYLKRVKELLKHKDIDVNYQDKEGYTSLMSASYSERTEIVKELLEHKDIDVNLKDKFGNTALMVAVRWKQTEIVKLLQDHKNQSLKEGVINEHKRTVTYSM